jgi:dipeptidyl aminopeptidase/acylaminoacyl peptidase
VPIQQAVDMSQALQAAKVRTRFVHYKDRGHMGITDEVIREARAFISELDGQK